MISGLSTRKKTASVGLDITSESIAATEVQNGGSVGRTAIVPLQPGVVKEGDLVNREVLSDALKDLFSRHKLNKTVRVGVANQRVVVRTMQLPLIEDDEELDRRWAAVQEEMKARTEFNYRVQNPFGNPGQGRRRHRADHRAGPPGAGCPSAPLLSLAPPMPTCISSAAPARRIRACAVG